MKYYYKFFIINDYKRYTKMNYDKEKEPFLVRIGLQHQVICMYCNNEHGVFSKPKYNKDYVCKQCINLEKKLKKSGLDKWFM